MKSKLFSTVITLLFFSFFVSGHAQQTQIWGITNAGGADSVGTIFKTDSVGSNLVTVYEFERDNNAKWPSTNNFCVGPNGLLYGMTHQGGMNNNGVIFVYDSTANTITSKAFFNPSTTGTFPYGSLLLASNGKMYGCTVAGGTNNAGTLFEFDPQTNIISALYSFNTSSGQSNGLLVQKNNGLIYGTCDNGGLSGMGVLFSFNPLSSTYTIVHHFDGALTGRLPDGELLVASNGRIYGVTFGGGTADDGTIFEYNDSTNVFTKTFDFTTGLKNPTNGLVQLPNGEIYGTTLGINGSNSYIYKYDINLNTANSVSTIFPSSHGMNTVGRLVLAPNGKLYGVNRQGVSTTINGTLFEFNPITNSLNTKVKFLTYNNSAGVNSGQLFLSSTGDLWGCAFNKDNFKDIIYKFNPITDSIDFLAMFNHSLKGEYPIGLTLSSDGNFYGTTYSGGEHNKGTLFKFDPISNAFNLIKSFNNDTLGQVCGGGLTEGANGTLYGLNRYAANNGDGVLYAYNSSSNSFNSKFQFNATTTGRAPIGDLCLGFNGNFYGVSEVSGATVGGVIFEYDPVQNTESYIFHFDYQTTGHFPKSGVTMDLVGNLFGTTNAGGANNVGVLYQYNINTNSYSKLVEFDGQAKGANPIGGVAFGPNGKLYGTTSKGGLMNFGVLFEYDTAQNIFTKLVDFDGINNGAYPADQLIIGVNGNLFGTTKGGGQFGSGTIFEYDIANGNLTSKTAFNGLNGQAPEITALYLDTTVTGIQSPQISQHMLIYPNPTNNLIHIRQEKANSITIQVLDVTGKVLVTSSSTNQLTTIDLSGFVNGIYLVKVSSDVGVSVMKVIKE